MPTQVGRLGRRVVDVGVIAALVFWVAPVSLLQFVTNWENIQTFFDLPPLAPWLRPLAESRAEETHILSKNVENVVHVISSPES